MNLKVERLLLHLPGMFVPRNLGDKSLRDGCDGLRQQGLPMLAVASRIGAEICGGAEPKPDPETLRT